jgi:lipopolysaccharide transport system ATP-binding protein
MKPAIRIDGLSKRYQIGPQQADGYRTLREAITEAVRAPFRRSQGRRSRAAESTFYALKDVSFEVQPGDVLGIIGRNGAGKSTLLKVLSRITEPTNGRVEVRGRVGTLLEVGTGFHPELTGRENIYLNGSILGMTRREVERKFEEIVAFSEIEQFLDTPVKRYSSGMYVRLAFAVAAQLEPEILIVDEVLAVGDAAFQRKCLGKMGDVARSGRTVLLVSHNMAAIQHLCDKVLVLSRGMPRYVGRAEEGIALYLNETDAPSGAAVDLRGHPSRRPGCLPILSALRFLDEQGNPKARFKSGDSMRIEFTVDPLVPVTDPQFGVGVDDGMSVRIFSLASYFSECRLPPITAPCRITCSVSALPLAPGRYLLSLSAGTPQNRLLDALDHAVTLDVEAGDFFGTGRIIDACHGKVLVRSEWFRGEIC